jgi:secreted PhoX family phosphatase
LLARPTERGTLAAKSGATPVAPGDREKDHMVDPSATESFDDLDDIGVNPSAAPTLEALICERLSRRDALKGLAAGAAGLMAGAFLAGPGGARAAGKSSLTFTELPHGLDDRHHVAPGYRAQVLIRWGDPVVKGAPAFDVAKQSAAAQDKQFGYDNDFMAYMPLPYGSRNSERGLLCCNHENTKPYLMFPGVTKKEVGAGDKVTREQAEIEMAAQGLSVVEVTKSSGAWKVVGDSAHNRRLSGLSAAFRVGGPAAGHARMKTAADPAGVKVIGTFNNCAGGTTPWGTVLSGEENTRFYFWGKADALPQAKAYKRYGVTGKERYNWGTHHVRFNLEKEPNEPNRFGWVVEYDPYEPGSTPAKRTALGRFQHEGATCAVSHDGRVAVYSGDDSRFEYVYKFVTKGRFDPNNRAANRDLLDEGTLYAAKFEANGTVKWLPLVFGEGPLTAANGFDNQGDVVIEARRAADLLGATPMDRPEDIEPDPKTGRVYVVLTSNDRRKKEQVDAANPRAGNKWGHIIELVPPAKDGKPDHAAAEFRWEFFLIAGDPAKPEQGAKYLGAVSEHGWLAAPDNIAFDAKGRMWISTDGMDDAAGVADGVFAADVSGPGRGVTRHFFRVPTGAEMCGPAFTPDGKTLFVAVQHPGDDKDSTFDKPSTRWPDFKADMPPRPSVVAIVKDDGGEIGS